jgi:hypothetical protein
VQDGVLILRSEQKILRKLSPEQLSNAQIMEWQTAKELYGQDARPITLVINLYDPKYNYRP